MHIFRAMQIHEEIPTLTCGAFAFLQKILSSKCMACSELSGPASSLDCQQGVDLFFVQSPAVSLEMGKTLSLPHVAGQLAKIVTCRYSMAVYPQMIRKLRPSNCNAMKPQQYAWLNQHRGIGLSIALVLL